MSTLVATPLLPPGSRVTKHGRSVIFRLPDGHGAHVVTVDTTEVPPRWSMQFMANVARVARRQGLDAKARRGVVTVTARNAPRTKTLEER